MYVFAVYASRAHLIVVDVVAWPVAWRIYGDGRRSSRQPCAFFVSLVAAPLSRTHQSGLHGVVAAFGPLVVASVFAPVSYLFFPRSTLFGASNVPWATSSPFGSTSKPTEEFSSYLNYL